MDIIRTGLNQSNVVVRGFNNAFSGALLSMVDNRIARVPSFRLNAYHFIPTASGDIERIEIVRGPGSALYGPNTASGVFHMITKSPFGSEGTTVNLAWGEQGVAMGAFRHAGSVNNRIGYKFSVNYTRGKDFAYTDPVEAANRAQALAEGADPTTLKIGLRDFDVEKIAGDGRLDFRYKDDLTFIVNGGFNIGNNIELTTVGASQLTDWLYSYAQGRLIYKNLFVQAYVNQNDAGDTYLLRDGNPIKDKSKFYVYQFQHSVAIGEWQNFTYGFDALLTRPDTKGTTNGINEDDDGINEFGVYLQSETNLADLVTLVGAVRVDDHNRLREPFISPRAGLIFKPHPDHTFRLMYNRAFSTPSVNNLFLDLNSSPASPTQPFNVRLQGVPESGFTFRKDSNGGIGGFYMQPLFPTHSELYLPAEATLLWDAAVEILKQRGIDIADIPAPSSSNVNTILRVLDPDPNTPPFKRIDSGVIKDVGAMKSVTTNTIEVGYKGVLGNKLLANVDVYYSRIKNFIGPPRVETPNVFYDPASLQAYISQYKSPHEVPAITTAIAGIPLGTVTPEGTNHPADIMLTFRNFADINYMGVDLSLTYYINRYWNVTGTYSYVSRDYFEEAISPIALNAPKKKFGGMLGYSDPRLGLDAQLRLRFVDSFPVNSGVFVGRTQSFTVLDFNAGIALPPSGTTRLSLTVQNLLDNKYREFLGVPELRRVALVRLSYSY